MSYRLTAAILLAAMLAGATLASAAAQTAALDVELNKIEDNGGGCSATLVMQNRTGETLVQLRLDLFVFDKGGIVARHLYLDTGPLRAGKTSVASFAILDRPCGEIGRLLINDVPVCKSRNGDKIDCVGLLNLSSRAAIPLVQ